MVDYLRLLQPNNFFYIYELKFAKLIFFRICCRDAMQTPVSPASPTEPEFFSKPKQLRKEARDMLSDIAFRKQSSPNLSVNSYSTSTSRRRRLHKTPSPESKAAAVDRK